MATITTHGSKRSKERCGLGKSATPRMAERALDQGLRHSEVAGSLRRFLDALYLSHGNATNMRIWNKKVYLFAQSVLITIIDVPARYHKTIDKINEAREQMIG